ncbi:2'-5' RNA ligase family protein [Sphingobium sp. H33]|uniref:2'-5' RNA ligase family protein n=1 Tax=Sphingobium nicotianae TaxID=2782607 RepID=A0A9X1D8L6_9SPHN|nr:2'-5' RNA ligase family protein [Sphingobium nicotianae]
MAEAGAPIIVTAELGKADQGWADALRRKHYPAERNQLPAHLILFHHLPPSIEGELRGMLTGLSAGPKPSATIAGAYSLGSGVAIAISSPDLLAIWAEIAARFERHLIPQDSHSPRLHVTIQNKVEPALARGTLAEVEASLVRRPVEIAALACWRYRGGPWSLISRHAFRG